MSESTARIETASSSETEALGIRLACVVSGGMAIALSGELGAGKTVFVRGIACGLSMPAGVVVTSPTYVLQHIYRGGRLTLHHIDAYRMAGGAGEFESSGLGECLLDDNGLVCIEWPERLNGFRWPAERIDVQIEHVDPTHRRITLSSAGPKAQQALKMLK